MSADRGKQEAKAESAVQNLDHSTHARFYDYYAARSREDDTRERFEAIQKSVEHVLAHGRGTPGVLEVADIGCGAGTQSLMWGRRGHHVHGLDISRELIELAAQRAQEEGLQVEFRTGTAAALPWDRESMDVCLVPELLEHVVEWERCLDEFARILRPGGVLFLSTNNKLCPSQQEFDLPLYSWYPAPLKRYCERRAVTTHPHWVNYAKYPAINWFTFYGLRKALSARGFVSYDRFDLINRETAGLVKRGLARTVQALSPLRLLGHVLTPFTVVVAVKREWRHGDS